MKENTLRLPGLTVKETEEIVPVKTILLGYVGSMAHGTYVPKLYKNSIDDKDILGVCIASEEVYFGLQHFEQKEYKKGEWDAVIYEIRKFFNLLLKQNPNIMSLLWLRKEDYIYINNSGRKILDNRHLFVSKYAYKSFVGYARGQLHRMTHGSYQGYMGEKRKQLVNEFGYDCKNASHLIRLLRMGIEFLGNGKLQVYRKDAEELKEIKSGIWSLEKVKKEAEKLFQSAEKAFIKSNLPEEPDYKAAEKLLVSIMRKELERFRQIIGKILMWGTIIQISQILNLLKLLSEIYFRQVELSNIRRFLFINRISKHFISSQSFPIHIFKDRNILINIIINADTLLVCMLPV